MDAAPAKPRVQYDAPTQYDGPARQVKHPARAKRKAAVRSRQNSSPPDFQFISGKGGWWNGRYSRIPGKSSVYMVKRVQGRCLPVIEWWEDGNVRCLCPAVPSSDMVALAEMVNNAKKAMGGKAGGSFIINEFKQVIVPSNRSWGDRAYVGEIRGTMSFDNPLTRKQFTIDNAEGLRPGDRWAKPYIGMPFQLRSDDRVAMKISEAERDRVIFPPLQDHKLIRALRSVRPQGSCRFVVTASGMALTKLELGREWVPVYVGEIDYRRWFQREQP